MTDLARSTLDDFLNALADRQPTPGGGGVAANMGALAAALGRMVAAYSIGKNTPDDARDRMAQLSTRLRTLDELQRALITQDSQAYRAMTEAGRSARQGSGDRADYQKAVLRAVAVPMEMATLALETLSLLDRSKGEINGYMVSDLGVAAVSGWAAVQAASYMVLVNLTEIDDSDARERMARDVSDLRGRSDGHRASLQSFVAERLEPGS